MRDYLRLLADTFSPDVVTPCRADGADAEQWWPEHAIAPAAARALCRWDDDTDCPLLIQCHALGRSIGADAGIWGGVQRGRWKA